MAVSWIVELPSGHRWGISHGVFRGPGPGCICIPVDQIDGLSREAIGVAVHSLLDEARSAEAADIAGCIYPEYVRDAPFDILENWHSILEKWQGHHETIKNAYLMVNREMGARLKVVRRLKLKSPPTPIVGFVYLLQCGPYYKIGVSAQVDERVKQLSTIPPFDLDLLHTIPTGDMYGLERDLHERFVDKRKNGEWFELDDSDVEYIKGL